MAASFDRSSWRARIAAWWQEHGDDWRAAANRLGVSTAYGLLTASAWLPLLAAYAEDPGRAVTALVGIAGGVGSNLVANLIQGAYDQATAPRQVEQELAGRPELRPAYQQILDQLDVPAIAQQALGAQWTALARQLREELPALGWQLRITTEGGAVIVGDVRVKGGDFTGRDRRETTVEAREGGTSLYAEGDVVVVAAEQILQKLPRPLSEPALHRATEEYLRYLLDRHRYLSLKGMGVHDRIALRLPLLDVYIPLQARVELPEGETWGREALRLAGRELAAAADEEEEKALIGRLGEPQPVLALLQENDGLIVLGDPGAGKTTFLKFLTLKLARGEGEELGLGERLPVLLPLSAYANALAEGDVRLDDFIAGYYHKIGADLPVGQIVREALAQGRALILLDGLDEVQEPGLRQTVAERVVDFYTFQRRAGNKLVLTSRVVGYREVRPTAEGLAECTLVDFQEDEIADFVTRWTAALERQAQGETPTARRDAERERAELLEAVQRNPGVRQLAANPLLLTILALMKRQGVALPERRVQLYDHYVRTLLSSWNRARGLSGRPGPALDVVQTMRVLAPLALWMHEENPGVGLVKRQALYHKLRAIYQAQGEEAAAGAARRFLRDVRRHTGLLLERGAGQYGFIHLTFEEYLAAVAVADLGQEEVAPVVAYLTGRVGEPAWREVSLLAVGYLGIVQGRPKAAGAVVEELVARAPGEPGAAVALAGEAVLDAWPGGVPLGSKERVEAALVEAMQGAEVAPRLRRQAGWIVGRLGWRPADLEAWVEIAPGPFLYSDRNERREIAYRYWIAKYPVTNAQYARFVRAGGYERRELWGEAGWARRKREGWEAPRWWTEPALNNPIFPVVGVSWYEAEAYGRWLTERLGAGEGGPALPEGYVARLPTGEEWERAVRGTDGRAYPWGEGFDVVRAHTAERGTLGTTAVCTYPQGVGPEGLWDGAGNVLEWCEEKALRGGSWGLHLAGARCSFCLRLDPHFRVNFIGFRVVVAPAL